MGRVILFLHLEASAFDVGRTPPPPFLISKYVTPPSVEETLLISCLEADSLRCPPKISPRFCLCLEKDGYSLVGNVVLALHKHCGVLQNEDRFSFTRECLFLERDRVRPPI